MKERDGIVRPCTSKIEAIDGRILWDLELKEQKTEGR